MSTARLAVLFTSLVTLMGCGDDTIDFDVVAPRDAAVDAPATEVSTGGGQTWPGTCDPVLQNCPSGQQCTGGCNVTGVMAKVFTCAVPSPAATATNGQDCGAGCARGHDCYVVPAANGGTRSICRKYCNTDAECPGGSCGVEGLVCTASDVTPIGRLCTF